MTRTDDKAAGASMVDCRPRFSSRIHRPSADNSNSCNLVVSGRLFREGQAGRVFSSHTATPSIRRTLLQRLETNPANCRILPDPAIVGTFPHGKRSGQTDMGCLKKGGRASDRNAPYH